MINIEQLKAEFGPYGSKEYPEVYNALRLLEEAQQVIAQRNGECDRLINELAALKGDQVPVYQVEADVKKDSENNLISMTWADVSKEQAEISQDDYGLLIRVLFTTPQNPVVLPVADHETEDGYKYYREETVKAAIEAAGGKVAK